MSEGEEGSITWMHSSYLCRTIIGKDSGGSIRGECYSRWNSVKEGMPFERIRVSGRDRSRIRKRRGMVKFERIDGDKKLQLFAARTTSWRSDRNTELSFRNIGVEAVKVKTYVKVRTQYVLRRKCREGEVQCLERGEDVEEIEHVYLGETKSSGNGTGADRKEVFRRTRRRRRRARRAAIVSEGLQTRRRRRHVNLEKFELFCPEGISIKNGKKGGWAPVAGSEEDKFNVSINATAACMTQLQEGWIGVPFLRCSGGRRRNQKFICMGTVRMKRKLFNGGMRTSVVCSIVVEEESKKIRTMTVRSERYVDEAGNRVNERTEWICCCDIHRIGGKIGDSRCWHIRVVLNNEHLVEKLLSIVQLGFHDDHDGYFGEFLLLKETDGNGTFEYERNPNGDEVETGDEEQAVIAIQLDDYCRKDLLDKTNRVAKRWSAWLTVDAMERLLVSVVWRPVNSGISVTRMICGMCRTEMARKCRHEVACEMESVMYRGEKRTERSDGNDSGSEFEDEVNDNGSDGSDAESNGHGDNGTATVGSAAMDVRNTQDEHDTSGVVMNEVENVLEWGDGDGDGNGNVVEDNVQMETQEVEDLFGRPCMNGDDSKKNFYPPKMKRSFIFCHSERRKAEVVTDLIERYSLDDGALLFCDPDGTPCRGIVLDRNGRRVSCSGIRVRSPRDKPRKTSLFTVNHGSVTIVFVDWTCKSCKFLNRYQGNVHGIFPAAAGICYTVELLYLWVSDMCSGTSSFRSVYRSTRSHQYTPSYSRRYETGTMSKWNGIYKGNRRYANDAVRHFINLMDLDSTAIAHQVYSCKKCELPMTQEDYVQLGLDREQHPGMKRIHSVVVDAKVMALLKDGDGEHDAHDVLTAAKGLNTCIVRKRDNQNAIKILVKTIRHVISNHRNRRVSRMSVSTETPEGYEQHEGYLRIRLWDMAKFGSTKVQTTRSKVKEYISISRWLVDNNSCLCSGDLKCESSSIKSGNASTSKPCDDLRKTLSKAEGNQWASLAFTSLFSIVSGSRATFLDGIGSTANPSGHGTEPGLEEGGSTRSDSDEENDGDVENMALARNMDADWIEVKHGYHVDIEYQLETVLEVITFCLVEPVTLGFFPFVVATGGNNSDANERTAPVGGISESSTDDDVRKAVRNLGKNSVALHRSIVAALRLVATCTHGGRQKQKWTCPECETELESLQRAVATQNAVIARFVADTLQGGSRNPVFTREVCAMVSTLVEKRVESFEKYMNKLGDKMHPSSIQYWKQFGRVSPTSLTLAEGHSEAPQLSIEHTNVLKSLYVFPGRTRCRNGIDFDNVDTQDCTKNYFKGNSVVPSFLTVQCACAHPKLLGFLVLKQYESISAALSSVLTHFPVPPRNVW